MSYAVSPQAPTDYWPEYFWLTKKYGESGTLHELRKSLCGQKGDHSDFFVWFSTVENRLAEIDTSRRETETYKTFVKTVSLLTEPQDPYTARHQKKVSQLAEGIARAMGLPALRSAMPPLLTESYGRSIARTPCFSLLTTRVTGIQVASGPAGF